MRRKSFYFVVTGGAALTYYYYHQSNEHYITNGVIRSSRSLYTISANVIDYKYSLQGLPQDTDEYKTILSEVHLRSAKRILKLCELNRGFYIKAGQFVASMRQIPKEYSFTLSSLQDQAVPCSFEAIKQVLITNFGSEDLLKEIFLCIDEQPIAAASIAQVHRAKLKDHQQVVLKIQYPGLKDRMRMDIATMSLLANCLTWFFPEYRFQSMVSQFSDLIALELDFIQEASNSVRCAINLKHNTRIKIPVVFQDLTTSQVLTMEYCKGRRIDDLEFIQEMKIDSRKVAKVLVEAFAEMIFVHGFVHGDPHPGNILVSLDDKNKQEFSLVVLDHGIYTSLDEEFRMKYCQLWKALILLDSNKIQEIGQQFGIGKYARYLPLIFTGRTINSKSGLGKGMSVEEKANLKEEVKMLGIGDISEFMESLPPQFLTVLRTDGLIRSLTSKLGSPQRVRLLVYAHYALDGLPNPHFGGMLLLSNLQVRLILGLLQWMEALVTWLTLLYPSCLKTNTNS